MRRAVLTAIEQDLVIEEDEALVPEAGDCVVQLQAAALNHRDVWITKGLYPGIEVPCTPGSDGAGVVVACGADVDPGWQGRQVVIDPALDWGPSEAAQSERFTILGLPRPGTHATHVAVPAAQLVDKPAHLDWQQAAALPLAGLTAWRALISQGRCGTGQTVLITGIGGGVALFALQFAVAIGARVLVTSSAADKREQALALGAQGAYDYTEDDWAQRLKDEHGGFDLAVDGAGGDGLQALIAAARPGARIVLYGATAGLPGGVNLRAVFWKQLCIQGSTMGSPADFTAMLDFLAQRELQPVIDSVYRLDDINQAYARMAAGGQFGKIVLDTA